MKFDYLRCRLVWLVVLSLLLVSGATRSMFGQEAVQAPASIVQRAMPVTEPPPPATNAAPGLHMDLSLLNTDTNLATYSLEALQKLPAEELEWREAKVLAMMHEASGKADEVRTEIWQIRTNERSTNADVRQVQQQINALREKIEVIINAQPQLQSKSSEFDEAQKRLMALGQIHITIKKLLAARPAEQAAAPSGKEEQR